MWPFNKQKEQEKETDPYDIKGCVLDAANFCTVLEQAKQHSCANITVRVPPTLHPTIEILLNREYISYNRRIEYCPMGVANPVVIIERCVPNPYYKAAEYVVDAGLGPTEWVVSATGMRDIKCCA